MKKTIELIRKLDREKEKLEKSLGIYKTNFGIEITPEMNVEEYSDEKCYLIHTLLHLFYNTGAKNLSRSDVERLHKIVKKRIKHENFDDLDYEHI